MSLDTYIDFGMSDNLGHLGIVGELNALPWKPNLHHKLAFDAVGNEIVQDLVGHERCGDFGSGSDYNPCP